MQSQAQAQTPATQLGKAAVRGTIWTYAAFYSGKLMVLISTIILARLLTKEDFGIAGYAVVVIHFLEIISDLGVGAAVIYYKDSKNARDTAFWLCIIIGVLLYTLVWVAAPLVGDFFKDERATTVTRVLALTFPISALFAVHDALLRKELSFGKRFIPVLTQSFGKGLLSIVLALLGFGYWSLVMGQVGATLLSAVVFWAIFPWRPALNFDRNLVKPLLAYGSGMVWVNILATTLINIDYLFVGRYLGAAALGVYTVAFRIPEFTILYFCTLMGRVIFPVYAKMQDDPAALKKGFLTTMRYAAMITVPLGLGMAILAESFVLTLFGQRWAEAIPVTRAIAIYALMLSLAYNAGDIYKAQGRMRILTQLSLVRVVMLIPGLYWAAAIYGSIEAVGWSHAFFAFLGGVLNLYVAAHVLKVSFSEVMHALSPAFVSGTIMALAVLLTLFIPLPWTTLQLILGVAVGAATYTGALWWFQRELVVQASKTLRTALLKR